MPRCIKRDNPRIARLTGSGAHVQYLYVQWQQCTRLDAAKVLLMLTIVENEPCMSICGSSLPSKSEGMVFL